MSTYISVARFRVIPEGAENSEFPGPHFRKKNFTLLSFTKTQQDRGLFQLEQGRASPVIALLSPCYFPVILTVIRMTVAHIHFVVDPASPAKQDSSSPAAYPREPACKSLPQSVPSKMRSRKPKSVAEGE
ncbi:MAG: hypothetical protein ABSC92_12945 [Rhizomicrobium sp.]|jgi:hypothetical protein